MTKKGKKDSTIKLTAADLLTSNPMDSLLPKNYLSAIDYVSGQSSILNSVTDQINLLTSPAYQPSILAAVTSVQSHLAAFSTVQSFLPNVDHLTAVTSFVDSSRQATLAISGLTIPSVMSELAAAVATDYKPWYEANIAKSSILSATAYSTLNIGETSKNLASIIGTQSLSALALQSSIVKATEFSLLAEKSLFAVTSLNLGSKIALDINSKSHLTSTFLGLSDSYSTLLKSYESNPLSYAQISPAISKIAPIEYFSAANLIEAISVEEDITTEEELLKNEIQYENEVLLSSHLPKIDPGLYTMWKGAIEAYHSTNSDRVRHFSTSIRELYTHLFQKLAPDSEIKKWTSNPDHFHEGRPTRKTRLLFICRNINNDHFNMFVKKDIEATLAFIDIFQKGTHDIDPVFSPNHLVTIKSKAENSLKFLLEIHFSTNE